jgi:hypothetical protein
VDKVKAAIFGHPVGQKLGGFEVVERVNGADGLGFVIADVHNPNGDFFTVLVLVGLWAVEIHGAERADVGKFRGLNAHND